MACVFIGDPTAMRGTYIICTPCFARVADYVANALSSTNSVRSAAGASIKTSLLAEGVFLLVTPLRFERRSTP